MPKRNQGRKPYKLDPDQIRDLAAIGCTKEEIAAILTPSNHSKLLSPELLEKRFYAQLVQGRMQLHRNLKHELVDRALNGNVAALIFALKVFCKLSDRDSSETESRHLTIHFDYNTAKAIESRATPIRDAVSDMLKNYRKDYNATTSESVANIREVQLLEDSQEPN